MCGEVHVCNQLCTLEAEEGLEGLPLLHFAKLL